MPLRSRPDMGHGRGEGHVVELGVFDKAFHGVGGWISEPDTTRRGILQKWFQCKRDIYHFSLSFRCGGLGKRKANYHPINGHSNPHIQPSLDLYTFLKRSWYSMWKPAIPRPTQFQYSKWNPIRSYLVTQPIIHRIIRTPFPFSLHSSYAFIIAASSAPPDPSPYQTLRTRPASYQSPKGQHSRSQRG